MCLHYMTGTSVASLNAKTTQDESVDYLVGKVLNTTPPHPCRHINCKMKQTGTARNAPALQRVYLVLS